MCQILATVFCLFCLSHCDCAEYFPHVFFRAKLNVSLANLADHMSSNWILLCICQLSPASSENVPLKDLQFPVAWAVYSSGTTCPFYAAPLIHVLPVPHMSQPSTSPCISLQPQDKGPSPSIQSIVHSWHGLGNLPQLKWACLLWAACISLVSPLKA